MLGASSNGRRLTSIVTANDEFRNGRRLTGTEGAAKDERRRAKLSSAAAKMGAAKLGAASKHKLGGARLGAAWEWERAPYWATPQCVLKRHLLEKMPQVRMLDCTRAPGQLPLLRLLRPR